MQWTEKVENLLFLFIILFRYWFTNYEHNMISISMNIYLLFVKMTPLSVCNLSAYILLCIRDVICIIIVLLLVNKFYGYSFWIFFLIAVIYIKAINYYADLRQWKNVNGSDARTQESKSREVADGISLHALISSLTNSEFLIENMLHRRLKKENFRDDVLVFLWNITEGQDRKV